MSRADRITTVIAGLLLLAGLAACGSSGNDDGPPIEATDPAETIGQTTIPVEASSSADGLLAYLQSLMGAQDDAATPLQLGETELPTDDVAQSSAL